MKTLRPRKRSVIRLLGIAGFAGAFVAVLQPLLATKGSATIPLPGGKANYVVAVGGLSTQRIDPGVWVRIGYYVFSTDGAVTHTYWRLDDHPARVDTKIVGDCPPSVEQPDRPPSCVIQTLQGFNAPASGTMYGRFNYYKKRLHITWLRTRKGDLRRPLQELWNVEPKGALARIVSSNFSGRGTAVTVPSKPSFSSYSATVGVGWGSNAALRSVPFPMVQQQSPALTQTWVGWQGIHKGRSPVSRARASFDLLRGWNLCTNGAPCMLVMDHNTNGCDWRNNGKTPPDPVLDGRAWYLGDLGAGRRNTMAFWCTTHVPDPKNLTCYRANNHVRALMQIVDDHGLFRGWVGTEVSISVNPKTLAWNNPEGDTFAVGEIASK